MKKTHDLKILVVLLVLLMFPSFAAAEGETVTNPPATEPTTEPTTESTTETTPLPDSDEDGIPDYQDLYPYDPENKPLPDRDEDGIPDGQDLYPDNAENKPAESPLLSDRDEDGIPDGQDLYPDNAENVAAAFDDSSEAAQNKYTHSLLIGIACLVLVGLVMGRKSLL